MDPYEKTNEQSSQTTPMPGQPEEINMPHTPPLVRSAIPKSNSAQAAISLTLGIFALIGFMIPGLNLILSIAGFVQSISGLVKKQQHQGLEIAGLTLSVIALFLSLLYYLFVLFSIL